MAEIKTRPATPEFRDGWDLIYADRSRAVEDGIRARIKEKRDRELADEFHAQTYESAHA